MFSDDDLMEMMVLKGGNALNIIYKIAQRASMDLDFSLETEINDAAYQTMQTKMANVLVSEFEEEGFFVFDFTFCKRPKKEKKENPKFWGGYRVEFKIIEKGKLNGLNNDIDTLRRNSIVIGEGQKRKFYIDLSKFEFCQGKCRKELDGLSIFVYTPEMIVVEKLRAICQQTKEYVNLFDSNNRSPRARDFFDIYVTINALNIDLCIER